VANFPPGFLLRWAGFLKPAFLLYNFICDVILCPPGDFSMEESRATCGNYLAQSLQVQKDEESS